MQPVKIMFATLILTSLSVFAGDQSVEGVIIRDPYPRLWYATDSGVSAYILAGDLTDLAPNGTLAILSGETLDEELGLFKVSGLETLPGELDFDTPVAENLGVKNISGEVFNFWCEELGTEETCAGKSSLPIPSILVNSDGWMLVASANARPLTKLPVSKDQKKGRLIKAGPYQQLLLQASE